MVWEIGVLKQVIAASADENEGFGYEISTAPLSSEHREVPDLLSHGKYLRTLDKQIKPRSATCMFVSISKHKAFSTVYGCVVDVLPVHCRWHRGAPTLLTRS